MTRDLDVPKVALSRRGGRAVRLPVKSGDKSGTNSEACPMLATPTTDIPKVHVGALDQASTPSARSASSTSRQSAAHDAVITSGGSGAAASAAS